MTVAIIKSGWLQRRTTILKNWKREWFVLTDDARLLRMISPKRIYEKPDDIFHINQLQEIRVGSEQVLNNIEPPSQSTRDYLMSLVPIDGDTWDLYAESSDDLLSWKISLEDAHTVCIEHMKQARDQSRNEEVSSKEDDLISRYQDLSERLQPHKTYREEDGLIYTSLFGNKDSPFDISKYPIPEALKETAKVTFQLWPLYMVPFYPTMWW